MDENKSQPLHVTGILVYRIQRQVEFLLLNDTFGHKKYWSAPKGEVIGHEDELKCALRNTTELTGLSVRDLNIIDKDNFRAEIKYLAGTRPKRVAYYLAQASDHVRVFTASEGLNFAWFPLNVAVEKVIYRSMQDVVKQASAFIESNKLTKSSEAPARQRPPKSQFISDRLETRMKNLNLALPLDSQRQAMSRQRLELAREQRQHHRTEKLGNGFVSPLQSPVMTYDNPLYKTRLCERFETEGFCPYGPKCTFAHGTNELRERPSSEEKVGSPPTARDGPENPLYKTRLCERFMKENFCQYGPKCNFAHGEHELRERPQSSVPHRDNGEHHPVMNEQSQKTVEQSHKQQFGYHMASQNFQHVQNSTQQGQQHPHHLPPTPTTPQFQHGYQPTGEQRPHQLRTYHSSEFDRMTSSASTFIRSEMPNNIFGRISVLSQSDSMRAIPTAPLTPPASSNDPSSDNDYPKDDSRLRHSDHSSANGDTDPRVDRTHKNTVEQKEKKDDKDQKDQKEQKEVLPVQSSSSPKTNNNGRRRLPDTTVTLKDLLKNEKASSQSCCIQMDDKKWIVEYSNDNDFDKLRPAKKAESSKSNSDKQSHEDSLINEMKRIFAQSEEQSRKISDDIKDTTRFEIRHDLSKHQLFIVLIRSLYEDATWEKVNQDLVKRENLFKKFVDSTQDQIAFLRSWEKFFLQHNRRLISKAPILFKMFYDRDYVEEDSVLDWYGQQTNESNEVKKKCEIFVNWLKNAEEEESDSV
ncbi:4034_t:CDS:2 [Paraglomus brasilianum]|uniref:4034_t:CDS:1 n=1 Tax=Paraglomus brasilianum TaxID=144538 RepID=A0A9N9AUJ3_9GLOM|nr:4034_t:CDS:2 [Paraglomus brasilianum]